MRRRAAGPDLSGVGRTYAVADLLWAVIEPGHAVTDLYAVSIVRKNDGTTARGLVVGLDEQHMAIAPGFGAACLTTEIPRDEIREIVRSDTSPMPAGLVNGFSGDDLRDPVAYLVSGADPQDPVFAP